VRSDRIINKISKGIKLNGERKAKMMCDMKKNKILDLSLDLAVEML